MTRALRNAWDALWGRGEYSVTVPPMDGALRPNTALDDAETLLEAEDVDNLMIHDGRLYFTQGTKLQLLGAVGEAPGTVADFSSDISATAISVSGSIAIALDEGKLLLAPSPSEVANATALSLGGKTAFVTALAFDAKGDLFICVGSKVHRPSQWKRDLMTREFTGSVWLLAKGAAHAVMLDDRLAFPNGIGFLADETPVISEAWKHRLLKRTPAGKWTPFMLDLPGYPGRIASSGDGGLWLCVFAPRSQMIEFVLREKLYRKRMIERIDEQYWVAPAMRSGKSFKEPLQGGGVKHLGIRKPWGPTRSYGLVVRFDSDGLPTGSHHSRSDGNRHGITSAVEWDGKTVVASKGDGALIALVDSSLAGVA
ncbi:strictosidine synthase [Mesorhizobium sp. ANAO-SY3R2]|uniref:strictosidine synthase n=1 Tax=Mesorhizobium sp. ANAO-SY3R2 TaxID=3166644 RepID=UPI00366FCE00